MIICQIILALRGKYMEVVLRTYGNTLFSFDIAVSVVRPHGLRLLNFNSHQFERRPIFAT